MPLLCTESGEKDAEISLEATKNGCTPRLRCLCKIPLLLSCNTLNSRQAEWTFQALVFHPLRSGIMGDWLTGTLDFFTKLVVQEQDDGPVTPRGSPWCDPAPPEYPVNSIGTALHQAVWTCRADAELRRHLNINNDDELRAAFKRADTNGDGELSHDEWAEAFGHVVEDTSCRSMLWRLFQDIDTDKNDKIDENEFVQGLHAVPPVSIRLRQLVVCALLFSLPRNLSVPMTHSDYSVSSARRTDRCWTRLTRRVKQRFMWQQRAGTSRRRGCS